MRRHRWGCGHGSFEAGAGAGGRVSDGGCWSWESGPAFATSNSSKTSKRPEGSFLTNTRVAQQPGTRPEKENELEYSRLTMTNAEANSETWDRELQCRKIGEMKC